MAFSQTEDQRLIPKWISVYLTEYCEIKRVIRLWLHLNNNAQFVLKVEAGDQINDTVRRLLDSSPLEFLFRKKWGRRRMEGIDNHLWMFLHFNDEYARSVIMTYNAVQWTIFNLHDGVMPTKNFPKNDNISKIQISSKEGSGIGNWALIWTCFSGTSIRSVDAQIDSCTLFLSLSSEEEWSDYTLLSNMQEPRVIPPTGHFARRSFSNKMVWLARKEDLRLLPVLINEYYANNWVAPV
ncbi:unnamed protein product [Clonostachys chloroleuca]|uniref:Uncharacterized protein n=1 Tax=Clonostachys chloroleuca TaxID=1926264 RepID=A0AA35PTW5_9HYPO|nr:unnamed protein product [Clonostachys chloroleuca]